MRHALDVILYTIGVILLLVGSALVDEARGAPPDDPGHVTLGLAETEPVVAFRATRPSGADDAALARGRRLTTWLLAGEADSIADRMSEAYRSALGGRTGLLRAVDRIRSQLGEERTVEREVAFARADRVHYYRIARYSRTPGESVSVRWSWRDDGAIVYLEVRPTPEPVATGHEDYSTKADLRLPFDGGWYVYWGGRQPYQNHHVRAPTQRFAYDFVVLRDGSTHTDDGRENADYHCWGRPVLAPAPGRVVAAVDSVPDNDPGRLNRRSLPGNHVVVDHGTGERSLLAHLRHGSVAVEEGQRVERGQRLGVCGNSGRSSEPHLHYHLQTGDAFGEGVGLPAQFRGYRADGEVVDRGEPERGQIVRPDPTGG